MSSVPIEVSWRRNCSTAAERFAAAILIALLSPLFLSIWIAISLLSARSALIAHRRIGQNGAELWVFKFRTMWACRGRRLRLRDAFSVEYIDDQTGPFRKSPDDSRVWGRFGRFCRRHSLDELPQLANVLFGEMSLVGPRPVTPAEIVHIYGSKAEEVLRVKPGLSGLWQISGRNRLSAADRCRLDLEYARKRSVRMYFRILMRTLPELFSGESAW